MTNSRGRGEIERLMDIDGDLVLDSNGNRITEARDAGRKYITVASEVLGEAAA